MIKLLTVPIIILLSACSTIKKEDVPAHCGLDQSWHEIEVDENTKGVLLDFGDNDGTVRDVLNEVRESYLEVWFTNELKQIVVCRYQPRNECGVRPYAKFDKAGDGYNLNEKAFILCWQH